MVGALDDPYTVFMNPDETKDFAQKSRAIAKVTKDIINKYR